ncbi:MAG: hypothetical protein CFE43_18740 [Burkholderiales bacterium PBB3]|nr:MAG: hypothetical protein CFE43_18740 [Burkholderiales bacterium PBB3]
MPRSLSVLLIEDSVEIRDALIQSIEGSGALAVNGAVDNAQEAIALLDQGRIEAAVIDLNLRKGSGLQVLAHLKQAGNPQKILRIVLSNHTTPAFKRICTDLGADYVLDKSLEFDYAIALLEKHALFRQSLS